VVFIVKSYRLELIKTKIAEPAPPANSSKEVAKRYRSLEKYDREHLVRLDLDNRNRIIGEETISIGTAEMALVSPRELFKGALLNNAVRIILIHNHPSGSAEPSFEDKKIENALRDAGEILGIQVMDFVIIGEDGWYWSSGEGIQRLRDLSPEDEHTETISRTEVRRHDCAREERYGQSIIQLLKENQ